MSTDERELKTVAVLGGSYGGYRAAQILAAGLPRGWRVVLVDRNSHLNHVYSFSRYVVLPGHEHKAFIPYDNLFSNPSTQTPTPHPHKRIHGTITSLHPHYMTYIPHADPRPVTSGPLPAEPANEETLRFDYAIYALGSHLPSPIDLWESRDIHSSITGVPKLTRLGLSWRSRGANLRPYTGTKQDALSRLRARQQVIETARHVLVVGGGALGIQFASDIAAVYPRKSVTLLHSRSRLLPRFDEALGDELYLGLQELGVHVILGERLDMSSLDGHGIDRDNMLVKTIKGREIEADLVLLCTGQKPNTSLLHAMDSRTVTPEAGLVRVSRTMQILAREENDTTFYQGNLDKVTRSVAEISPNTLTREMFAAPEADTSYPFIYPHFFAIGDAADAFGACKAGHTAYYQGEVAARNVIRLIKGLSAEENSEEDLELEEYMPSVPMIKVSLGLTKSAYEVAGVVGTKDDGIDDLGATIVWKAYGHKDIDDEGMWM